ncbi:winged helix-turn-helix transcription repressor DNA-binding protein [Chaetomidium leptoderma]|uniref:Histone H1 n=1 Tax=Chaetomidium leptoderma TaxID=669021 RepID=A0AAN7A0N0_9PEZI|nr:winged helix-turn-helix transcription repressor DNA-binding protein [Chaetomidium leptoderma]
MPAKKTETKSDAGAAAKPKYQDMITDAIVALKDRNGSSRQSLKKYVRANNTIHVTDAMFDSLFNKALKAGVEKGAFEQPKGPSGGTKLAKKAAKPAAPKKVAAPKKEAAVKETKEKKPAAAKKAAPKKAAPKKETAAKKETKEKKAAPPKKEKKAAAPKKAPAAPAVVDKPTVLTKTKSGRVAKTVAKPAAPKKAAPKKAATKKEKTPKKAEAAA